MTKTRFETPTWNETYTMLLRQADKIRRSRFKPDVILGVSRGGLIPARLHSDLLENPCLATAQTECYYGLGKSRETPVLAQPVSMPINGKKVLVVDDVADTGRSLKLVTEHVVENAAREVMVATLYRKPWSMVKPDYCEKQTELWVVFPWDLKETVRRTFENRGKKSMVELASDLYEAGLPKPLPERFLKEMVRTYP
ncbi:MAG TPA: phosphoribosyltransferase [Candidatus Bathyarchaeia archaeon]|nr:phosphoribosyltransferase [Candidatus Bathyarchaeia archaeon]